MRIVTYLEAEKLRPYTDGADSGLKRLQGKERERFLADIRENGILAPLLVARDQDPKGPKNRYLIYTGLDYYEAALEVGIKELPCLIFEDNLADDTGMFDFAIQDLFPAFVDTLSYFRENDSGLKIENFLIWKVHKYLSMIYTPAEARMVWVNYPDGTNSIISCQKFQKIKRYLPKGTQFRVISRFPSNPQ